MVAHNSHRHSLNGCKNTDMKQTPHSHSYKQNGRSNSAFSRGNSIFSVQPGPYLLLMTRHWGSIAENCLKTSCKRRHFLIQNSWKTTCLNESAFRAPAVEMTVPLEVLVNIVENCLRTGKETSSGLIFPPDISVPTGVQVQGWAKTWM